MNEKMENIKNERLKKEKEGFEKLSNAVDPLASKVGIKPSMLLSIIGGVIALIILVCAVSCIARPNKEEKIIIEGYKAMGMSTSEAKAALKKLKKIAKDSGKALKEISDYSDSSLADYTESFTKQQKKKGDIVLKKEEDFEVDLTSDQQGVVIKGVSNREQSDLVYKVIIPKTIEGLPVKEISSNAFGGLLSASSFTIVELPPTLEKIGSEAFENCENLEKVNLSSGLKTIECGAFRWCSKLKEIEIPDTVQELGSKNTNNDYAGSVFSGCTSLSKVKLPKGLKKIYEKTFSGCEALTEINIPDSVEVIEEGAFRYCSSLKKINLPNSIKEIRGDAFEDCQALRDLTISDNVTSISFPFAKDIYARDEPNCAFSGCSSLSLKMKAKLKELGYKDEF